MITAIKNTILHHNGAAQLAATLYPTKANVSKDAGAKPWVYGSSSSYDRQAAKHSGWQMHTLVSSQPKTSEIRPPRLHSPLTVQSFKSGTSDSDALPHALPNRTLLGLNIPEMDLFDQDEIDQNPVLNAAQDACDVDDTLPLIGALLVAEGLVTREQLKASLLVQAQDHPGTPLGQIMLRSGYIDEISLERVVELQRELKSSLFHRIEAQDIPLADLTALVLHQQNRDFICQSLRTFGVAATVVRDGAGLRMACAERRPDMILIDADVIDDTTLACDEESTPVLVLPITQFAASRHRQLPRWAKMVVERFVEQVRAQSRREELQERLHQREFELSVVATLGRAMTAAPTPQAAMVKLMITIRDLFGVEAGTLYRFDRGAEQLVFEVVLGPHQETLYQQRLPIDRGLAGWVVRNSEPLLIPDVKRDVRFEGMFDHQSGFQTRSVLCVPMVSMGEVCGVIQLINKLHGEFNERDLQLLRIMAALGALTGAFDTPLFECDLGT